MNFLDRSFCRESTSLPDSNRLNSVRRLFQRCLINILVRIIMSAVVSEKARKDMFNYMDADKDGKLSIPDFKFTARAVGIVASEYDFELFCKGVGKDTITYDQYSKMIDDFIAKKRFIINEECQLQLLKELRKAFDRMDKRKKGLVPIADIKTFLTTLGETLTASEFDEVFRHRPKSVGNEVTFEQFFKIVIGKSTYNLHQ